MLNSNEKIEGGIDHSTGKEITLIPPLTLNTLKR